MATSSRTRSKDQVPSTRKEFQRSISPSERFCSSTTYSSAFASSSSSFSSQSTCFVHRSASPTRININSSISSVRFSIDRPSSPSRSIAASPRDQVVKKQNNRLSAPPSQRKTCMCSPTNHPGSFRCSLHRSFNNHPVSYPSSRLNARRSAMTNSLVRIGTVEGDWLKRSLSALIRPSSHQQKRRATFQPRPSRLSIMSKAEDI